MPKEQHADQDKCRGNCIPDKVHPMDALTATKPLVFVIDIKTIPALHFTNQPRQKFKLAQSVGHSVPKQSADRQPDARPTSRRINRHKTAADISLRSASFASAEEVDDGADGWEGVALGRGEANIECCFKLIAELDQVERITTEVANKGGVEAHLRRREVEVPCDNGLHSGL